MPSNLTADAILARLRDEGVTDPDKIAATTEFLRSRMTASTPIPAVGETVDHLVDPPIGSDVTGWFPGDPSSDPRAVRTPVADDRHAVVERMVAGGESEADIANVIQHYGSVTGKPASAAPQPSSGGALGAVGDFVTGIAKGAGSTAANLGSLVSKVPGLGSFLTGTGNALGDLAATAIYGHVAPPVTADQATAAANEALAPTNTAQKVGKIAEQVGETLIPAGAITEAGKGLSLAGRIGLEGAANAGIAAAQGGNPIVGGALGAAIPAAGAALRAAAPSLSAADAAAVALANRAGVPVDAATATGNRAIAALQHVADRSLLGSLVGGKATAAQTEAIEALGDQLASKIHGIPVTAEDAGTAAAAGVAKQIEGNAGLASDAYGVLRKIEADPANAKAITAPDGSAQLMPLPVNLESAQKALQSLYGELIRQRELAPASIIGDKATALQALDKIVNGPTHAPLSTVDAVLSDLKRFARGGKAGEVPTLATPGQAAAQKAIANLDGLVQRTAAEAGPDALEALREGRTATKAKYAAADVLDSLNAEPVKTFQSLTAPGDSTIGKLRAVAEQAPDAVPQIGRAKLDSLLDMAPDKAAAEWKKLGTATKQTLYEDPSYVSDLDSFFRLRKLSASTPNPSGTAHTLLTASQGGLLLTNPLTGTAAQLGAAATSALLHSRVGVQLLTQGLRLPTANRAAAAAWMAAIGRVGAVQGSKLATASGQ